MVIEPYYESKIYIGSIKHGPSYKIINIIISADELWDVIGKEQEKYKMVIPLRVTETAFLSGLKYRENGFEIAAINYPRVTATIEEIDEFMLILGRRLLTDFFQHRVTIVNSKEIIMLTEEEDRYDDE